MFTSTPITQGIDSTLHACSLDIKSLNGIVILYVVEEAVEFTRCKVETAPGWLCSGVL